MAAPAVAGPAMQRPRLAGGGPPRSSAGGRNRQTRPCDGYYRRKPSLRQVGLRLSAKSAQNCCKIVVMRLGVRPARRFAALDALFQPIDRKGFPAMADRGARHGERRRHCAKPFALRSSSITGAISNPLRLSRRLTSPPLRARFRSSPGGAGLVPEADVPTGRFEPTPVIALRRWLRARKRREICSKIQKVTLSRGPCPEMTGVNADCRTRSGCRAGRG